MGMNGWSLCGVPIFVTFCKLSLSLSFSLVEEIRFVYRACPKKKHSKTSSVARHTVAIYQPCILCQRPASIVNVGWVSCSRALQHSNSALQPHDVPWYLSRFFWAINMSDSLTCLFRFKQTSGNTILKTDIISLSLSPIYIYIYTYITFICETLLQE